MIPYYLPLLTDQPLQRCDVCTRTNKFICVSPIGQVCNVCWQQKRHCSNGSKSCPLTSDLVSTILTCTITCSQGHCHACEPAVKEEPKSPKQPTTWKRKAYSTTSANPIGLMDVVDVNMEPAQPVRKQLKSASAGSSHIRFDGVEVQDKSTSPPKATRKSAWSAKANSKKDVGELFTQLSKEFQAISKMCEEIADMID